LSPVKRTEKLNRTFSVGKNNNLYDNVTQGVVILPSIYNIFAFLLNDVGKMSKTCQSCGMPISKAPQKGGTNANGSKNLEYCS